MIILFLLFSSRRLVDGRQQSAYVSLRSQRKRDPNSALYRYSPRQSTALTRTPRNERWVMKHCPVKERVKQARQRSRKRDSNEVSPKLSYDQFKADLKLIPDAKSTEVCGGNLRSNHNFHQMHYKNKRRSPHPRYRIPPEAAGDKIICSQYSDSGDSEETDWKTSKYNMQLHSGGRRELFSRSLTQSSPFGFHYETYQDSESGKSSLFDDPVFLLELKQDYIKGKERRKQLKELAAHLKNIDSLPSEDLTYNFLNPEELSQINLPFAGKFTLDSLDYDHSNVSGIDMNSPQNEEETSKFPSVEEQKITHVSNNLYSKFTYHDPTCMLPDCSRTACKKMNYNSLQNSEEVPSSIDDLVSNVASSGSSSGKFTDGWYKHHKGHIGPAKALSALCLSQVRPSPCRKNMSTSLMSLPIEELTPEQRYISKILTEVFEDTETGSELESLISERGTEYCTGPSDTCSHEETEDASHIEDCNEDTDDDGHSLQSANTLRSDITYIGSAVGDNCYEATLSFYEDSDSDVTSDVSLIFHDQENVKDRKPESAEREPHILLHSQVNREDNFSYSNESEEVSLDEENVLCNTSHQYQRVISKDSDSTSYFGSETVNYDSNSTGDEDLSSFVSLEDAANIASRDCHNVLTKVDLNNVRYISVGEGSTNEDLISEDILCESSSCSLPSSTYSSEDEHNRRFEDSSSNSFAMDKDSLEVEGESTDEYYEAHDVLPNESNLASKEQENSQPDNSCVFEADRSVGPIFGSSPMPGADHSSGDDSGSFFSDQSDSNWITDDDTFENYYNEAMSREIDRASNFSFYRNNDESLTDDSKDDQDTETDDGSFSSDNHLYLKSAVMCKQEWESFQDLPDYERRETIARSGNSMYFSPNNYSVCKTPQCSYNVKRVRQRSALPCIPVLPKEVVSQSSNSQCNQLELSKEIIGDKARPCELFLEDEGQPFPTSLPALENPLYSNENAVTDGTKSVSGDDDYLGTFDTRRNTFSDRTSDKLLVTNRGSLYENDGNDDENCPSLVMQNNCQHLDGIKGVDVLLSTNCPSQNRDAKDCPGTWGFKKRPSLRTSYYDNYGSDSANSDKSDRRKKLNRKKLHIKCSSNQKLCKFPTSPDDYVGYQGLPSSRYDEMCRAINEREATNIRRDQLIGFNPKWMPHGLDSKRQQKYVGKKCTPPRRSKQIASNVTSQLQELSKYIQKELRPLTGTDDGRQGYDWQTPAKNNYLSGNRTDVAFDVEKTEVHRNLTADSEIQTPDITTPSQLMLPTLSQIRTFYPASYGGMVPPSSRYAGNVHMSDARNRVDEDEFHLGDDHLKCDEEHHRGEFAFDQSRLNVIPQVEVEDPADR